MIDEPYKIVKYQNSRDVHKATNRIELLFPFGDNCITKSIFCNVKKSFQNGKAVPLVIILSDVLVIFCNRVPLSAKVIEIHNVFVVL